MGHRVAWMCVVMLSCAACSGSTSRGHSAEAAAEARSMVVAGLRDAVRPAVDAGAEAAAGSGSFRQCGGSLGDTRLEYAASARLRGLRGSGTSTVRSIVTDLRRRGWTDTSAPGVDDVVQLRRERVNLTLSPGTSRTGASLSDGSWDLSLSSRCLDVTPAQFERLEGEKEPIGILSRPER